MSSPEAGPPAGQAGPRPERSADETDVGWGDRVEDADEDERRYLEDRPPHWGSD